MTVIAVSLVPLIYYQINHSQYHLCAIRSVRGCVQRIFSRVFRIFILNIFSHFSWSESFSVIIFKINYEYGKERNKFPRIVFEET